MTKVYFVTDLLGSTVCFQKAVNVAAWRHADLRLRPDITIISGNLTSEVAFPALQTGTSKWQILFGGKKFDVKESDLDSWEVEHTKGNGAYMLRFDGDERKTIDDNPLLSSTSELGQTKLQEARRKRLQSWVDIACKKLIGDGRKIYIIPGGYDPLYIDEMIKSCPVMELCENQCVKLSNELYLISTGYIPWESAIRLRSTTGPPRFVPNEAELAARINNLVAQLPRGKSFILNTHVPPYNTRLDIEQTWELPGPNDFRPVGSKAVRSLIEDHKPVVSLHGCIHSPGFHKIGSTMSYNPGFEPVSARGVWMEFAETGNFVNGDLMSEHGRNRVASELLFWWVPEDIRILLQQDVKSWIKSIFGKKKT